MGLTRASQQPASRVSAVGRHVPCCAWGDSLFALGSSDCLADLVANGCSYPGLFNGGVGGQGSAAIKTRFDADDSRRHWNTLIWSGRNDVAGGFDWRVPLVNVMGMVASLPHTRFRVLEILPAEDHVSHASERAGTATRVSLDALNAELSARLGAHFIWLLPTLQASGTGTGQDAIDVTNGIIPSSLRQGGTDPIHLSLISVSGAGSGNKIVSNLVGASIAGGWAA